MKYEYKKNEKDLYNVKQIPKLVDVVRANFIMIRGEGNPNELDFSNRISALYSVAYEIKKLFKNIFAEEIDSEYTDFTVFPLEGIWKNDDGEKFDKNNLKYTIMIKQPPFITRKIFNLAIENVKKKKSNILYDEITFDFIEESRSVQILHIGSFDAESLSFEKMDNFIEEQGFTRKKDVHTEIYLSNKNRTAENKLKTILRYNIK